MGTNMQSKEIGEKLKSGTVWVADPMKRLGVGL